MSYVFIVIPYSLAVSEVLPEPRTLNPMIIAFDALASTTSLSVIAPTAPRTTFTLTPSTSIFYNAFLTASKLPFTSAFKITLISFTPSFI